MFVFNNSMIHVGCNVSLCIQYTHVFVSLSDVLRENTMKTSPKYKIQILELTL